VAVFPKWLFVMKARARFFAIRLICSIAITNRRSLGDELQGGSSAPSLDAKFCAPLPRP
jgi:hypothetical protein